MNSTQHDVVKALVAAKKYDVITEYAHVCYPDKGDVIVNEYAGQGIRLYKDNKGATRILCPKNMDVIQEGHVAQAIANGTIFDDADEVDRNASVIERTSIPYDAMVNSGKDTPKQLKPMIAIVIGKMDDNGSFNVSDSDRENGVNFVHDLCDKDRCPNTTHVVDNYLEKDTSAFYSPEMGKNITELDNEVDDIVDTKPEDVVTSDDTVDSYDDYNMEEIESDPKSEEEPEEDEEGESDDDNDDDNDDDDENGYDSDINDDKSEDNESDIEVVDVEDDEEDDDDYVEEGAGIAIDKVRGENIKTAPDGSYHSGSDKPKEKKKALKLNSDSIVAKSSDLKDVMKGDFIRCADKDGKPKMIKITVGKPLIDKNEKVKITINGDSAKITVAGNDTSDYKNKKEVKAPEKKRKLVRTPFGTVATWVKESTDETIQEEVSPEKATDIANGLMNKTPAPVEPPKAIQEEDEPMDDTSVDTGDTADVPDTGDVEVTEESDVPTEGTDAHGNVNTTPVPMSANTKALLNSNSKYHQEGFLSKKPKKLKPIGRDVVAYITCEMNDIRSANDQAMLAGYTCSKIELVDFYIVCLDTQDARYIVPHNKQYLTQMKADLERLLTQILRIRPINRSDQIWRVNYPSSTV